MLTSVVSSNPNNIIYLGFIEPCYSQELGGGSGEAYLVLGSKRSLSVVDLLTMKTLWTVIGRFNAITVAKDDAQASAIAENGWIACGMAASDDAKEDAADAEDDKDSDEFSLAVFTYASSDPLLKRKMTSKILSAEFCPIGLHGESKAALVILSEGGELSLVHRGEDITSMGKVARLNRTLLPQLPATLFQSSLASNNSTNDPPNIRSMEPNWLESYIDAESSNISSVATIYKDFMLNFLPKVSDSNRDVAEPEEQEIQWEVDTKKDPGEVSQDGINAERLNRIRAAARLVFMKNESPAAINSSETETGSGNRARKKRKDNTPEEPVEDAEKAKPAKKRSSSRKKASTENADYTYG